MTEQDTSPAETPPEGSADEPTPENFDADYVAKLRKEAAKYRTEAKANAEAARKLAELEESQKSESQRLADAKAAAEQDAAAARAELLRYQVAAKHGITDADDVALFLTGTDEDTLTRQATRLAERAVDASKPRPPRPDPNQGHGGGGSTSTADQFAGVVGGLLG